jgi:sensor domain CHASE-containing protein
MNLQKKMIAINISITLSMLILISLFSYFTINKGFSKLENENANINCKRVQEAINREFGMLKSISIDWAEWDDTYLFIQNKYSDYPASNLNDETLANLNIEFISFTNASGDIFYFINRAELSESEVKSIKEYLSDKSSRRLFFNYFFPTHTQKQQGRATNGIFDNGV